MVNPINFLALKRKKLKIQNRNFMKVQKILDLFRKQKIKKFKRKILIYNYLNKI